MKYPKPTENRVLFKRLPPENKIGSGLLFRVDNSYEKNIWCEVLAVGPGKPLPEGGRQPMSVKPGDLALIRQWSGEELSKDVLKKFGLENEEVSIEREDVVECIKVKKRGKQTT